MKHLGRITVVPEVRQQGTQAGFVSLADAKTDLMNAMWRAWSDYIYAKKNEIAVP